MVRATKTSECKKAVSLKLLLEPEARRRILGKSGMETSEDMTPGSNRSPFEDAGYLRGN